MGIQGEFFERPVVNVPVSDELRVEESVSDGVSVETHSIAAGPIEAPRLDGATVTVTRPTKRSMKDLTIPKLYYSISEVSRLTGLEPYVLRYWDAEFHELKPQKNRAGNRVYSNKDIKFILKIKELLREQRYTIEGAKHILESERLADVQTPEEPAVSMSDPSQIALQTESKATVPTTSLTLDEIRSMKEALKALKAVLIKG